MTPSSSGVTLELKGTRPACLPTDAIRDVRELKGFRHLFRHDDDLNLDPVRVEAAAENADRFDGRSQSFLAEFRGRCRDELDA